MNRTVQALEAIAKGKMVILVDDEDRENEGDLVMAAELVTAADINFMAKYGRGLICLPMTDERLRALEIPMMVDQNTSGFGTAFTVSIEARTGVSTGISAADRAHTIRVAVDDRSKPSDLVRPGHVFPLRAKRGGVLVRTGQTEGSVDLARLAGCKPAGVICEIMNEDGSMARRPDLERFAEQHGLMILTVAELIEHRLSSEQIVRRGKRFRIEHSRYGVLEAQLYATEIDEVEHIAIWTGKLSAEEVVPVRVQTECRCGPRFGSMLCECGASMWQALEQMHRIGRGVFVGIVQPHLLLPSMGDQLSRLAASKRPQVERAASDAGAPSESDRAMALREFGVGAQILRDLGLGRISLLSNHPRRLPGLEGFGLVLEGYTPLETGAFGVITSAVSLDGEA